jgi:release factor glutamine methyltransferase
MQTVKAALEDAFATVDRIDAQVLMGHVLGVGRAWLAANPMHILTETQDARVDMLVAQRALGQPVAYLVGKREFYGRDFTVTSDVLIPRPETETLVEAALEHLRRAGRDDRRPGRDDRRPGRRNRDGACPGNHEAGGPGPSVLDLGTGSGAIAVTLACELPGARIVATDASPAALAVARANAKSLGCEERIEFLQGSWYAPVAGQRFDLVVSNPPYVARDDDHLGQGDLRFEPRSALADGSPDGLDSIRAIAAGARAHLAPGGALLLEHGYDQARAVARLLVEAGFAAPISIPDLAGIPRVAGGII